ncbi:MULTISPECIES: HTH domain-containing protein [unclassified Streptomyces]|uniref:HTH domain-containing protein n=1 Tax=unclassified Streptomyces TaxID=2593676 RepID=UPI0007F45765|nr:MULTISPECIES: HTH domain-containing protein [unclassified Streptomyces]MCM1976810.1 HTH domain-containing protein [Streptomyces sp. G1]SBT89406.1 HTH domain-containing protein [Streptomyces sp. DI166]
MTRADRRTLVRQLAGEGLSRRAIAKRLNVSKDTVRRDLDATAQDNTPDNTPDSAPGSAPVIDPPEPPAPQAAGGDLPDTAPDSAPDTAPVVEPPAPQGAPVAQVPDPHAGIEVSRCAGLRRDLALLAQTGKSPQALVYQAVIAMAHAYRLARARGDVAPGVPFTVHSMRLAPLPHRAGPAGPAEAG